MAEGKEVNAKKGPRHEVHKVKHDGQDRVVVKTTDIDVLTGIETVSVSQPYTQPRAHLEIAQNMQAIAQRLNEIKALEERNDFLRKMLADLPPVSAADAITG